MRIRRLVDCIWRERWGRGGGAGGGGYVERKDSASEPTFLSANIH